MTEYNKGCETIITKEMIQEDWFGKMIKDLLWKVFENVRDKDYDIKVVMSQIIVPPKVREPKKPDRDSIRKVRVQ